MTHTRMFITSLWADGSVHLERAELGIAPPRHRENLRRRWRNRNLVETGNMMEFDTRAAEVADPELVGMRTRIKFEPEGSATPPACFRYPHCEAHEACGWPQCADLPDGDAP